MKAFIVLAAIATLACVSAALAEDESFALTIKDHAFSPAELVIPAGKKVKLVIDNQDASAEEFESHKLKREKVIAANSKGSVFIGPLEAGEYPFFGDFHQDTAKGKIIVK
jgi:plastocyanin